MPYNVNKSMEFLDPKKQKQHMTRLFIGYFLVGVALLLTTVILLYRAYGYGFKNGQVIQNGLIFISSSPSPADIYINGEKRQERTNVRLLLSSGQYTFELKREGYRPWKRAITLEGGSVARFDYPMLFPADLTSGAVKRYDTAPGLATQSPDRRWIVVQSGADHKVFDVFDLSKPDKAPVSIALPEGISKLTGAHSWKVMEWANDNSHLLLQHIVTSGNKLSTEYILLDREDASRSVNLTEKLGINPSHLELRDKKFDKYFLYSEADHKLWTASIDQPQPQLFIEHVLGFKSHGDDIVLYATDQDAQPGKAAIKLLDGNRTHTIRQVAAGSRYILQLARYENAWYVAAGAPSENRTYVYKNPASTLVAKPDQVLVPVQVLKANSPSYVAFSDNARFIMVQGGGGQAFSVYDAETNKGYNYTVDMPMDAPQEHANWMDGHRMMYVSGGKAFVFDFDKANQEVLVSANPGYSPFFDRDYRILYTLAAEPGKSAEGKDITQSVLNSTPLRLPQDR